MKRFARDTSPVIKAISDQAVVHFMVALPCEAKPLIQHYRLSRWMDEPVFPIYRNESITLTVTGIGKIAMAAGTAYTHAILGKPRIAAWLNVGVAGHRNFRIGTGCLAHKITDRDSGRSWYPPLVATPPCDTESLLTGSNPETEYSEATLYDMEGSAFYDTASRFSSSELVQCFKVVSDNRLISADVLASETVASLLGQHLVTVDRLLDQLRELLNVVGNRQYAAQLESYNARWHFTVQQSRQLEALVQRWILLDPDHCPNPEQLADLNDAKQVLAYLRKTIERLPLVFA